VKSFQRKVIASARALPKPRARLSPAGMDPVG
jgi:hypothetical protein